MKRAMLFAISSVLTACAVAMPSRNELKKVQPTVNELMAEDISAMKGGKQSPDGAAAKAEELAGLATDEASKFLLLKGAFGLYVEGGKYEAAIAALDALKAQVKDVPDKVLADIVRAKMKKVSKKDGGAILSYYAQLDRRMRYAAEKAKFEKAVKANPSDKDAHRQLAFATAVLDGWPAALAEFALAGGDIAAAAKAEQNGNVAAAADVWWACAGASGDEDEQEVLKAHAAALYAQAIKDDKLDGLKRALAEKRIAECGGGVPQEEAAKEASRKEVASTKTQKAGAKGEAQISSAPLPVIAPSRVKYNWSIPAGKKRKTMEIDLGGEKLTLQGVSGGTYDQTVVTRPFWIATFPLSAKQCRCLDPDFKAANSDIEELFANDGDVHVVARMRYSKTVRLFEILNAKFGGQLPKGWVIRPLTLAEAFVAVQDRSPFGACSVDNRQVLGACQQKGRYREVKAPDQLPVRERLGLACVYLDYRQRRRKGLVMMGTGCLCVDRLLVPAKYQHIDGMWNPDFQQFWDELVKPNLMQQNPFLYAESEDSRFLRMAQMNGNWTPWGWYVPGDSVVSMCVAFGFDYVGDWKKKHGK